MMMFENLTQPELGILYIEMGTPLRFQKFLKNGRLNDDEAIELHQMMSDQKPDTALISLGLAGIVYANYILQKYTAEKDFSVLATELKYFSIDVVERFGRVWINAREHEKMDRDIEEALLLECPELLNAYGSIVQEIHEISETAGHGILSQLGKVLEYQAYSHANLAESYLDMLKSEGHIREGFSGDPIPVPSDLQREPETV